MDPRTHRRPVVAVALVLSLVGIVLIALFPACEKDTPTKLPENTANPTAQLVSHSDCKEGAMLSSSVGAVPLQDCFEYELKDDGTLLLTHVNAAFNCCPDSITAAITISNDTITITEGEVEAGCHCLCLYDLDYRFENIEAGTYLIRFVEPYVSDGDEPLRASIDLSASPSGSCCVDRNTYPWTTGGVTEPIGMLVSRTGCGGGLTYSETDNPFFQKECALYDYSTPYSLTLSHVNAAFNCCPDDITADVIVSNDTIRFIEHEVLTMPCLCECLYTLNYRIENLAPGTYTFVFGSYEPLIFTANVASVPSDTFCIDRNGDYPWSSGGGTTGPVGTLISHTDCKGTTDYSAADIVPTDMSCLEWRYSPGGILSLKHINAAFNCCPGEITAEITVANGTITIVEHESESMCDCSCLYDLDFEIRNLEPGQYAIKIVEPYVQPADEKLEFSVDLTNLPSGIKCAYRAHYPWMYQGTMQEDKALLDRLRREIIGLIGTPSCGGGDECRYIGLGDKPCGGVWEYLIYSTATVDANVLRQKVAWYNELNAVYNLRYHVPSDCMYVLPPRVGCVEGLCSKLDAGK